MKDSATKGAASRRFSLRIILEKYHNLDLALMSAIKNEDTELVAFILQQEGVDVNATNRAGFTAMHFAAPAGHIDIMDQLLRRGAQVDLINENGLTPVELAINAVVRHDADPQKVTKVEEAIRWLIEHGANASSQLDWVMIIAENEPARILPFIFRLREIQDKHNVNYISYFNQGIAYYQTRLHGIDPIADDREVEAFKMTAQKTIKNTIYLQRYLDGYNFAKNQRYDAQKLINQHYGLNNALITKAGEQDVGVVKFLIDQGANVRAVNTRGFTALHYAMQSPLLAIKQLLVQRGADVNAENNIGATPLHIAIERYSYGFHTKGEDQEAFKESILFLIAQGADIHYNPNNAAILSPYEYAMSFNIEFGPWLQKIACEAKYEQGRRFAHQLMKNHFPFKNMVPQVSTNDAEQADFKRGVRSITSLYNLRTQAKTVADGSQFDADGRRRSRRFLPNN